MQFYLNLICDWFIREHNRHRGSVVLKSWYILSTGGLMLAYYREFGGYLTDLECLAVSPFERISSEGFTKNILLFWEFYLNISCDRREKNQ